MHSQDQLKKRIKIRSWRRGMKETDLILGNFIDERVNLLTETELSCYEKLLLEDDQKILSWIFRKEQVPREFFDIIEIITEFTFKHQNERYKTTC